MKPQEFFETADKGASFIVLEEEVNKMSIQATADYNDLLQRYIFKPASNDFGMDRQGDRVVFTRLTERAGVFTSKEGEDQRTMADSEKTTPFRPRYRKLSEAELMLHDQIKLKATELLDTINKVPAVKMALNTTYTDEERANLKLSFRHLEDAVYRAVKALTA